MTKRKNILKAIRFERPEYVPMVFHINSSCWNHYDNDALQDLMEAHPFLFPNFKRRAKIEKRYGLNSRKDAPYTDPWGCVWKTTEDGITGSVHEHPLSDWNNLSSCTPPDPEKTDGIFPIDWQRIEAGVQKQKEAGQLVCGRLPHGHTFLRLQDIRGYENLIYDMADERPELFRLTKMIEEFNYRLVQKWIKLKPDMMKFPEDLGMQSGPMLSPGNFRKFIKPSYQKLMKPAREQDCIVHMHSDGDIRSLVDDLIDGGVDVINLQDLVNGIEWIADRLAGRTCIDLDIDRQAVTAQGTPKQIDSLIKEEVEKLGSAAGGLMMIYGLYPGVPLKNIEALMNAMEKYANHYS